MPAGHSQRNPPPEIQHLIHPQVSPTNKSTHIRNKDGTKLITVPSRKVSNPESASAAPSPPPPPPPPSATMDYSNGAPTNNLGGKKKKKKRGKQPIVQQQENHRSPSGVDVDEYGYGRSSAPPPPPDHAHQYQQDIRESMAGFENGDAETPDVLDPDEDDPDYYSDQEVFEDDESYSPSPRVVQPAPAPAASKKKNKKKKKKNGIGNNENSGTGQGRKGKDRIWNTSTAEERERIKDFWLSLGEEDRRSLVKVEKEAVLRKMKEQQKHSCSCSVCGRKRTAIEEELEVLYDAYYEELEQYANQQQTNKFGHIPHSPTPVTYSNSSIPPPPPPGPPPAHHAHPNNSNNHRIEELDDDEYDDEDDDEFEDEDEEEVLEQSMPPQQLQEPPGRPDFFNFGNSLTVQGGILTVADDLLKNDGKKFIEMMEQLAERRMAREEEASAAANGHSPMSLSMQQAHAAHNHPQPEYDDDEDYDEEDDDEEYDDEEEEEDEPDTMTEEQRMEEGRRMFQIFAARMFEQRVLTAYREKVARERQSKLLEELEEENRQKKEREEKKAKDKDKKKERKRIQRQAKEEERQRKEAEKAAEELKLREIESQKAEELKKRKEEQKQKRDLEKKAQDEERQRKEEERRRRIQEEKEREMERERKRKEHQERERKKKEDAARKMKEEKEAREKEAREKKEQAEKEKKQRDAKAKKDAVEKERKRKEDEAKAKQEAAVVAAARRTQTSAPSTLSQSQSTSSVYGSPHLAPAIPKQTGASPGPRSRQTSQQGSIHNSQGSSPKTPNIPPRLNTSASPGTPIPQHNASGPMHVPNKVFGFPMTTGITPTSPLPHFIAPPPGVTPPESAFGSMGMTSPMQAFLPNMGQRQSIGNGIPMYPPGQSGFGPSPQFRGFGSPNGIPMQIPTAPGMRSMSGQGRGGFMGDMSHQLPPGVPLPPPGSPFIGRAEPVPMSGHSRAPSGSFEPIHRPTPIQRPSSVAPPKSSSDDTHSGIDELSKVMGSRALLEDDDVDSLPENMSPSRRTSNTQFAPRPIRGVPISSPLFGDALGPFKEFGTPSWSNPMPLGGSLSGSLPSAWANGAGWSETDAARSTFNRRRQGRIDQIRIITCEKCRELGEPGNQFVEFGTLQRAIQGVAPHDLIISSNDIADVLDIEGDPQNGGGTFKVSNDASGRTLVQYEPDQSSDLHRMSVGEIGSPGTQGAVPFRATPLGPPGMASSPAGF